MWQPMHGKGLPRTAARAVVMPSGGGRSAATSLGHASGQANRTIMETEELGANILGDLRSQRETLQHATGTLQRANEGLARSKRTLSAISRRAFENKLIMWGLILLLTAGIVLLLLFEAGAFSGSGDADEAGLPPPAPQKLRL